MKRTALAVWLYGRESAGVRRAAETFLRACARSGVYGLELCSSDSGGGRVLSRLGAGTGAGDAEALPADPDVVVALDGETFWGAPDESAFASAPGRAVIYDSDGEESAPGVGARALGLPFARLAPRRALRGHVAAGALVRIAGIEPRDCAAVDGPEAAAAFSAGHDYAAANFPDLGFALPASDRRLAALRGSDALGAGALVAGCRFHSFPAAGRVLGERVADGAMIRAEGGDALSAALMAVGAGFAGARAMAELPPGEAALASQAAAWAAGAEVPAVFVASDAAGTEAFAGVVMGPTSVEDAYASVAEAFDLAETFHTPVTLLAEPGLLGSGETVPLPPVAGPPRRGLWAVPRADRADAHHPRYGADAGGVSPRAVPGHAGLLHAACPPERERGEARARRIEKLRRKRASILEALRPEIVEGPERAQVTIIARGAACAALRPAALRFNAGREGGAGVNLLPVRYLSPFPGARVARLLEDSKRAAIAVTDPGDPLVRLVRQEAGVAGARMVVLRDPADPGRLLADIRELLEEPAEGNSETLHSDG
ncbi:MAG: hypothetical protein ABII00_06985 [Elusimicrobiota bacterium]